MLLEDLKIDGLPLFGRRRELAIAQEVLVTVPCCRRRGKPVIPNGTVVSPAGRDGCYRAARRTGGETASRGGDPSDTHCA